MDGSDLFQGTHGGGQDIGSAMRQEQSDGEESQRGAGEGPSPPMAAHSRRSEAAPGVHGLRRDRRQAAGFQIRRGFWSGKLGERLLDLREPHGSTSVSGTGSNAALSRSGPPCNRDFTVPMGIPRAPAISWYLRP